MKIHNTKNLWSGLMFMAFGITFAIGSTEYQVGTSARMGPGYFPMMLGILMSVLGAIVTFSAFKPFEGEGDAHVSPIDFRSVLLVLLAIGAFALLLPKLGFIVALAALVFIGALASHEFSVKESVMLFVGLTILALIVFIWGLELQMSVLPPFLKN